MRIKCKTYFDISATGVTGHFKSSHVPFTDKAGQRIENEISWHIARNQQRNWETLVQLIGMRTQIFKLNEPKRVQYYWEFDFEVDTPGVFGPEKNPLEMLVSDAAGVPMLIELWNRRDIESVLVVDGPDQNIWFEVLP
jgi:hypothetical protein